MRLIYRNSCTLVISIVVVIACLLMLFQYSRLHRNAIKFNENFKIDVPSLLHINNSSIIENEQMTKQGKYLIVIGILSAGRNVCFRDVQRRTFIRKSMRNKHFYVKVYFLLDYPNSRLERERMMNNDVVYLNTSKQGYKTFFGHKFYYWLKYAVSNFPDALLIGRMDDDVFLCVPQIFDRLYEVKSRMLYYGYSTESLADYPERVCLDDMFLLLGIDLARRIARRPFCSERAEVDCLPPDLNHPPREIRQWIQLYDDVMIIDERESNRMVYFYTLTSNKYFFAQFKTLNFCEKHILYHKASVSDLYGMSLNNSLLVNDNQIEATVENTTSCNL